MKHKILKLSTIILLFIGAGCEETNWIKIELSNFNCGPNTEIVANYVDVRGTISSIPGVDERSIFIFVESLGVEESKDYILPCNLPEEYSTEGLQIIFDGELKEIIDYVATTDSISSPMVLAHTVILTNLKIKDYE